MRKKILNWLGIFAMVAFLVTVVNVSDVNADTLEGDGVPAAAGEVLEGDELSGDGTLSEDLEAPAEEPVVDDSEGEVVLGEGEEIIGDEGEELEIETGWVEKDGYWYYYDEEGNPVTGWYDIDGSRYYFEADGKMATEWKKIDGYWYYFEEYDGWMYVYGPYEINGKIYGFDKEGKMITGWFRDEWYDEEYDEHYVDWYYFGADGVQLFGWQKIGKSWYYFDPEYGNMYSDGIITIGGTEYAFAASGAMVTGWYEEKYEEWYDEEEDMWYPGGSDWYYFKSGGAMHYGWLLLGKTYYYLDKEYGWMYSDGIWNVGGVWDDEAEDYVGGANYAFKPNGAMVTGWYKEEWYDEEYDETWIDWYYFKSSGAMQYGWLKLGKTYYYFDKEYGWMYSDGIWNVGKTYYAFKPSGAMITGWYKDIWYDYEYGEYYYDWYYFKSSGAMQFGWLKLGTKWYYFDSVEGWMYSDGAWEVNGVLYGFNKDGSLTSGWVYDPYYEEWFYFNKNGTGYDGWLKSSGKWYYISEGWMCYDGVYTIDGEEHLFDANGKWLGEVY